MTERTARQQNLEFTGVYESSYNKDKAKSRAAEIRKQYKCRAVLVDKGHGVSVYADEAYRIRKTAEEASNRLAHIQTRKERAYEAYLAELAKIEAEEIRDRDYVARAAVL